MRVKEIFDAVTLNLDPSLKTINPRVVMLKISQAADLLLENIRRADVSFGLAHYDYNTTTEKIQLPPNFRRAVDVHYLDSSGNVGDILRIVDKRNSEKFPYSPYIEGRFLCLRLTNMGSIRLYYHPYQPPLALGYIGAGSTTSSVVLGDVEHGFLVARDGYCIGVPLLVNDAATNTSSENVDAPLGPSNDDMIINFTAVAAGSWTGVVVAQPGCSRNLVITIKNDSGGALDLYEGSTAFLVVGTFNGAAQSEVITYTSTAGNKAVANGAFRYKYGIKPFDTITSVTLATNPPANGLKIGVGIGTLFGSSNEFRNITSYASGIKTVGLEYALSSAPIENTAFEIGMLIGDGYHFDVTEIATALYLRDFAGVDQLLMRAAGMTGQNIQGPDDPLFQE